MRFGIRLHDMAPGDLAQRAATARAMGFTCVQLALTKAVGPAYAEPGALTPGLAAWLRASLSGLDVAVLGCYLNLAHPNQAEAERILRRYTACLRLSTWLGPCLVGTETGNPNEACRYDPAASHTPQALDLFIRRLRPVVAAAERLGAMVAIEPVWSHIVCDAPRARQVLEAIASPCLGIILDPVNLLPPQRWREQAEILDQAVELLGEAVHAVHLKDCLPQADELRTVALGEGIMNYRPLMAYLAAHKPHIHILLENTAPENAGAALARAQALAEREPGATA